MTWVEAIETLYSTDPATFIATRTALVKQARAAQDPPLAAQIQALRRPTRSAWLVNTVARARPDELGSLLDLGPALAAAHSSSAGDTIRELSRLRREAVDGLVRLAVSLGHDRGYTSTEAVRAEVQIILDAALTHPAVGDAVRAGVLTQAPESAASFPTELFASLDPATPRPTAHPSPPATTPDDPAAEQRQAEMARAAAQQDLDEAARLLDARERALTRASETTARLTTQQAKLSAAHQALQSQLVELTAKIDDLAGKLSALDLELAAAEDDERLSGVERDAARADLARAQARMVTDVSAP